MDGHGVLRREDSMGPGRVFDVAFPLGLQQMWTVAHVAFQA